MHENFVCFFDKEKTLILYSNGIVNEREKNMKILICKREKIAQ